VGLQRPAVDDLALDAVARDPDDPQLEAPIVEEDLIARLHVLRERRVGGRDQLGGAFDRRVGGDGDPLALHELDGLALHPAGPDLRTGEVLKEGHGPAPPGRDLAHGLRHREVLVVRPVGEVEAKDVDPRLDQLLQLLGAA
jgi:hypothetical protein